MRLNRYLASCGVASRRGAEEYIREGRVRVNGVVCTELATFVEPGQDRVEVDGRRLHVPVRHTYYLLHKPVGVVTTASDPEGRATVLAFVPPRPRVFPVGRLDYDTSGALLLTDDGTLAHRLLHPRYQVEKEYDVFVEGHLTAEQLAALSDGVELDDGRMTAPARVEVVDGRANRTRLRMVIHEGRNRQVRRMLEAVGHAVLELKRLRVGPVALGTLEEGTHRELTAEELAELRRLVRRAAPRIPPRGGVRDRAPRPRPPRDDRELQPGRPRHDAHPSRPHAPSGPVRARDRGRAGGRGLRGRG